MDRRIADVTVRGITFTVTLCRDSGFLVGDAWGGNRESGHVMGLVASGKGPRELIEALEGIILESEHYLRDEGIPSPKLEGLDYTHPERPEVGKPETWVFQ